MRKILLALVAACAMFATPCYGQSNDNVVKSDAKAMDSLSYALGVNVGSSMKHDFGEINLDVEALRKGLDGVFMQNTKLKHEEAVATLSEFFSQTLSQRMAAFQEVLKSDSTAVFNAFVNEDERAKISYAVGLDVGNNLLKSKIPVVPAWFSQGVYDGWQGSAQLAQEKVESILQHYFMVVVPTEAAKRSADWLATKATEKGVKTTDSGLLYKVIKAGSKGKAAKNDDDVVKVHYVGRLQDGTVFDASRFEYRSKEQQDMIRQQMPHFFDKSGKYIKEDEPIEFPLGQVIKGWAEGVKLVGPGGKIKLYIPAELAYGERGAGNVIGPNEALEFEVEVLEVTPSTPSTPAEAPADEPSNEVEKMPSFKGGDYMTFRNWVMSHIRYPQIAMEKNISGRVVVTFIIERNGKLSNIKVLQSPDSSLSAEVVRVLKSSPKWKPGIKDGKAVRILYNLPVDFTISN